MEDKSSLITRLYTDAFPFDKVKSDLFQYLMDDPNSWFIMNGENIQIELLNVDTNESEAILLNKNDQLKVLSYSSMYLHNGDFYFEVLVGMGQCNEKGDGFVTVEKGMANLKYNNDLSLYDIDFFTDQASKG
jgi:hypothetical protein